MKRLLFILFATILCGNVLFAQTTVSGKVTAAGSGEPLEGVTVFVKNMDAGAFTGSDGTYKVEVPNGGTTLVFTFLNRKTVEETINGRTTIDVSMQDDIFQTDEVQITALNISRDKKSLGYASQQLAGAAVNNVKETNLLNSLSGKVAGMQVAGGSGNLGSSTRVTIRGIRSLTGENQPLYVVDGVPMDNSNFGDADQARGGGGYDYGSTIQDLNPNDIESMNVLKGAAATALYGSRGSNGVIVITTKKGSKNGGKSVQVELNSQTTFETVAVLPKYQNLYGGGGGAPFSTDSVTGDNFIQYDYDESWGPHYDATKSYRPYYSFFPTGPLAKYYGKSVPWVANENNVRDFFQTGVSLNNSVSISGGNEMATFRLGYTNLDQTGVIPNSHLQRNTINLNTSLQASKKLSISASVNYVNNRAKGRTGTGYDGETRNPVQSFTQWHERQLDMSILRDAYMNDDGSQITWNIQGPDNLSPLYWDNPYWTVYKNYENDGRDRVYGNITAAYKLTDHLTLTGRVMNDFYSDFREERIAKGSIAVSKYNNTKRSLSELNSDMILDYKNNFGEHVTLNAFVGGNIRRNNSTSFYASTTNGLNLPDFYNISNSIGNPYNQQTTLKRGITSVFGSTSFGFYNMVYVDLTARNDWSSTLPAGKNSYFYPSVSGSFVFSELNALKDSKILSFGKLRANWAKAGNDAPAYVLQNTYTVNPPVNGSASTGTNNSYKNPYLKPEITTSQEVGLDLRFFKDRVGLDVAAYQSISRNQILALPVSSTTGYSTAYINAGKIQNKGIEATLRVTPVKTKNFSWDISANFAKNNNKVLELYRDENGNKITNYRLVSGTFGVSLNATEGQPYGTIQGTDFVMHNGKPVVNANGYYIPTAATNNVLGSIIPNWVGGINNNFTYKNFSAGFLIDVRNGGSLFSNTVMWGRYTGIFAETAADSIREKGVVEDAYKQAVDATGAPMYDANGNAIGSDAVNTKKITGRQHFRRNGAYYINSLGVFDGGFVKLREARISYTIPNSAFKSGRISDVTFAIVGRNLWLISKNIPHIDPDNAISTSNIQGLEGAQLPSTRTIGFNVNAKF